MLFVCPVPSATRDKIKFLRKDKIINKRKKT